MSLKLLLADLLLTLFGFLGDTLLAFSEDHFDVARVRHEGVDSTVSTVCSSAVLWGLVDGHVFDVERIDVQTLELGVGLGVSQKLEKIFARFLWPSTLASSHAWSGSELLGLGTSANTSVESDEGNTSLVLNDVLEVSLGLAQVHAFDHFGGFAGVLEVNTDVFAARFATLCGVARFCHITPHGGLVQFLL